MVPRSRGKVDDDEMMMMMKTELLMIAFFNKNGHKKVPSDKSRGVLNLIFLDSDSVHPILPI